VPEVVLVPVRAPDEFVEQPIKLLKLDAEGAEPEVLKGLKIYH